MPHQWRTSPSNSPTLSGALLVAKTTRVNISGTFGPTPRLHGGQSVYEKVKPIMFGLIAGDLLAMLVPNIVGTFWYYWSDNYEVLEKFSPFVLN